ncbi:MAG: hypothetical protein CSA26_07970 [Desulfobacterales bacterium]|nr:MAG: hypothetical protein CSA26_07970 [Desulfobacterales bacterium]
MTGGLFAILDDIAILLDDAAIISKVAAKKTAGILGDDLAVNAEKATGFKASRELPVLWAITKGSLVNKLIILPMAFLLSAYASWLIVPILILGGAYLCYEGVEKIYQVVFHRKQTKTTAENNSRQPDLVSREKLKIRSAIRTDFILSIEIIVITLGTVIDQSLLLQIMVVSIIALLATIGVYGIVALLVRMDDTGFFLIRHAGKMKGILRRVVAQTGSLLVAALPKVIRALGIVGTIAMLLVGGGMFIHNIEMLHTIFHRFPSLVSSLIVGIAVGIILVGIQILAQNIRSRI